MITMVTTVVVIAWFTGFWLETESACEESAILSRRIYHPFYNETLQAITSFENEFFGRNILCNSISQSLKLEIQNPTLGAKSKSFVDYNDWHDDVYFKHTEKSDIPAHDFTIVNSKIPILPQSFLSSYPDIVMLDLRSIHIKTIKPGAFRELTKLERLYLDGNEISVISVIFNFVDNLQMLTLSKNNISTIDFEPVSSLKHLNYLDLSGNPITKIRASESSNNILSNLQTLLLNDTLIKEIKVIFTNELNLLNLSSSNITYIEFSLYPKSKRLDLSYNQIVNIVHNNYSLLSEFVYLNHNNLSYFSYMDNNVTLYLNISNNELETITVSRSTTLQTLDASYNSISTIQNNSFVEMFSLTHLYLQNNQLTTIPVSLFRDLHSLTYLDLSSNNIRQFQSGTFNTLANLESLNIQHNQLTTIFQLNSLTNLKDLYADHNNIKFNLADLKLYFHFLRIISFNHNPWSCENLVKTYHGLKQIQVVVAKGDAVDVDNLHGIACSDSGESIPVDPSESVDSGKIDSAKANANDETLDQFFNFDFHKSKFYKYFDEDYAKSNFFSYLRNYKFVIGNNVGANNNNKSETQKLTSLIVKPESGGGGGALAILNLMVLVVIALLLFYTAYKKFRKDSLRKIQESISMQDGLIA